MTNKPTGRRPPRDRARCSVWLALLALAGLAGPVQASDQLALAEQFIDAFYSFDAKRLEKMLADADQTTGSVLYYQGWAKGGHYSIVDRAPCRTIEDNIVCDITVEDDLMRALGIDFHVTDTFELTIADGAVRTVNTRSNDLPIFWDAMAWVLETRPELKAGPCLGLFDGGPTPGACVRAVVDGFRAFTQTQAFADYRAEIQ